MDGLWITGYILFFVFASSSHLRVHDSFLFETSVEHVHGEHLAPQVTVVLSIVATSQVSESGRHIGSCWVGTKGTVF